MVKILPKVIALPLLFLLLLILALILASVGHQNQPYQFFTGSQNLERQQDRKQNPRLERIISHDIPKLQGNWAVVIRDLKTGKNYTYNENEVIPAASLYKLAVMWAAFAATQNGQLTRGDLEPQLTSMITYSDNDSAIFLAEKFGWNNISALMQKEGLTGIDLADPPQVTAQSILDLLERIYTNTAVSQAASKQMKELLFAQEVNDRIPKYLPEDVKVGHKTGELDNLRHDAGIVLGKKSHYIFVFLSETASPTDAAETIANLSKQIFDALEGQ